MQITPINQNNKNQSFGMKFKLSKETVKAIEKSTGLTYKEMTELPLDKCENLMKENLLTVEKLVLSNTIDCMVDSINLYKAVGAKY